MPIFFFGSFSLLGLDVSLHQASVSVEFGEPIWTEEGGEVVAHPAHVVTTVYVCFEPPLRPWLCDLLEGGLLGLLSRLVLQPVLPRHDVALDLGQDVLGQPPQLLLLGLDLGLGQALGVNVADGSVLPLATGVLVLDPEVCPLSGLFLFRSYKVPITHLLDLQVVLLFLRVMLESPPLILLGCGTPRREGKG